MLLLTFDPGRLSALLEFSLLEVRREVNGLPDVPDFELGLRREEVEEVSGRPDPVVHHHRLHQLVLAVEEVVRLTHGETAALSVDLGRAGA